MANLEEKKLFFQLRCLVSWGLGHAEFLLDSSLLQAMVKVAARRSRLSAAPLAANGVRRPLAKPQLPPQRLPLLS